MFLPKAAKERKLKSPSKPNKINRKQNLFEDKKKVNREKHCIIYTDYTANEPSDTINKTQVQCFRLATLNFFCRRYTDNTGLQLWITF